jgi:prephenate dehydratase
MLFTYKATKAVSTRLLPLIFSGEKFRWFPAPHLMNWLKKLIKTEKGHGVMAIENSIAGSILPNYNLLQKSNLTIIGEVYLHIDQNLLVNKNVQLEDIREVHSHPMACNNALLSG